MVCNSGDRTRRLLRRVSDLPLQQTDQLTEDITREVGMPLKLSRRIQVQGPASAWSRYAEIAESFNGARESGTRWLPKSRLA